MQLLSRKEFLRRTLLLSLGLTFLPYCKKDDTPSGGSGKKKDILIIGAGISGLAAARKLTQAGHNVRILEASDHYGGRIQSVDFNGYIADLGASWIHGIRGNPLYDLVKKHHINTKVTHYDPSHIYDTDGSEITAAEWNDIEKKFDELYKLADKYPQKSMQDLLNMMEPNLNFSAKMKRLWYGAIRSEYEIPYATESSHLSARAVNAIDSFPGDDVVFPNGMAELCDILAKGLKIEYHSFVTKIDYSGDKVKVSVINTADVDPQRSCKTCHQGIAAPSLNANRIEEAEHLICTLPLNILKQNIVAFNPKIPQPKADALKGLGMGIMNKVFLKFSTTFWDDKAYFLEYLEQDSSKIIEFFSPAPTGSKNVLVAVLAGKHAKKMESKTDAEVIQMVMDDLKGMFGNSIPAPVAIQRTAWHGNQFSLGSYPHLRPGYDYNVCDDIARPLSDKVFFAGDATHRKYLATAHGAYLSGIRAAEEIMKT